MALKLYRPTSPGRRFLVSVSTADITAKEPEKSLVRTVKKAGGRNFHGFITARNRAGGAKRVYRLIDWRRQKDGIPARVATIEYDPNRAARIALLHYADGEKRYILAPSGLAVGATVVSGPQVEPRVGNCMELRHVPLGMPVHNIELAPGRGAQLVRGAGTSATVTAREERYVQVTLPSGEGRRILGRCRATLGALSNPDHKNISIGKAGRNRWLGRKPHVRGTAKNPVDHPHGGGEGRTKGGRQPVSATGVLAKGGKTRRRNNPSSAFILRKRRHRRRR
jgi:large subunit ribosomal protein L2